MAYPDCKVWSLLIGRIVHPLPANVKVYVPWPLTVNPYSWNVQFEAAVLLGLETISVVR